MVDLKHIRYCAESGKNGFEDLDPLTAAWLAQCEFETILRLIAKRPVKPKSKQKLKDRKIANLKKRGGK